MLLVTAYKKAGYPHLPVPLSEAFHSPTSERTEPEYPRWSVYITPKSVLEGTIALSAHSGLYILHPSAFISASALDWFICIVEVSDSQKQCINDAYSIMSCLHPKPLSVGIDNANLQFFFQFY